MARSTSSACRGSAALMAQSLPATRAPRFKARPATCASAGGGEPRAGRARQLGIAMRAVFDARPVGGREHVASTAQTVDVGHEASSSSEGCLRRRRRLRPGREPIPLGRKTTSEPRAGGPSPDGPVQVRSTRRVSSLEAGAGACYGIRHHTQCPRCCTLHTRRYGEKVAKSGFSSPLLALFCRIERANLKGRASLFPGA
jgi:hypothetical protein